MGRRDVELAAVGVFDGEDLAASSVDDDFGRTDVLADAVVDVDDVFAGFQIVEVRKARTLSDRRVGAVMRLPLGEDAVGLGDDEKPRDFESSREVIEPENECAAFFCRGEMLVKPFAGGIEEFRMVRFVRTEFGEARERRGLERVGRRFFRSRVS